MTKDIAANELAAIAAKNLANNPDLISNEDRALLESPVIKATEVKKENHSFLTNGKADDQTNAIVPCNQVSYSIDQAIRFHVAEANILHARRNADKVKAGVHCLKVQSIVGFGNWGKTFPTLGFNFGERTASKYMRRAEKVYPDEWPPLNRKERKDKGVRKGKRQNTGSGENTSPGATGTQGKGILVEGDETKAPPISEEEKANVLERLGVDESEVNSVPANVRPPTSAVTFHENGCVVEMFKLPILSSSYSALNNFVEQINDLWRTMFAQPGEAEYNIKIRRPK